MAAKDPMPADYAAAVKTMSNSIIQEAVAQAIDTVTRVPGPTAAPGKQAGKPPAAAAPPRAGVPTGKPAQAVSTAARGKTGAVRVPFRGKKFPASEEEAEAAPPSAPAVKAAKMPSPKASPILQRVRRQSVQNCQDPDQVGEAVVQASLVAGDAPVKARRMSFNVEAASAPPVDIIAIKRSPLPAVTEDDEVRPTSVSLHASTHTAKPSPLRRATITAFDTTKIQGFMSSVQQDGPTSPPPLPLSPPTPAAPVAPVVPAGPNTGIPRPKVGMRTAAPEDSNPSAKGPFSRFGGRPEPTGDKAVARRTSAPLVTAAAAAAAVATPEASSVPTVVTKIPAPAESAPAAPKGGKGKSAPVTSPTAAKKAALTAAATAAAATAADNATAAANAAATATAVAAAVAKASSSRLLALEVVVATAPVTVIPAEVKTAVAPTAPEATKQPSPKRGGSSPGSKAGKTTAAKPTAPAAAAVGGQGKRPTPTLRGGAPKPASPGVPPEAQTPPVEDAAKATPAASITPTTTPVQKAAPFTTPAAHAAAPTTTTVQKAIPTPSPATVAPSTTPAPKAIPATTPAAVTPTPKPAAGLTATPPPSRPSLGKEAPRARKLVAAPTSASPIGDEEALAFASQVQQEMGEEKKDGEDEKSAAARELVHRLRKEAKERDAVKLAKQAEDRARIQATLEVQSKLMAEREAAAAADAAAAQAARRKEAQEKADQRKQRLSKAKSPTNRADALILPAVVSEEPKQRQGDKAKPSVPLIAELPIVEAPPQLLFVKQPAPPAPAAVAETADGSASARGSQRPAAKAKVAARVPQTARKA